MSKHDPITGRYVYLTVEGIEYRVYYEEAGEGIPLLVGHTAGSDGRQYRHMLCDPEVTKNFRVIAFDLPYHGKSLPPYGVRWWEQVVDDGISECAERCPWVGKAYLVRVFDGRTPRR